MYKYVVLSFFGEGERQIEEGGEGDMYEYVMLSFMGEGERQIEEGRGTCISMLCCPSWERERDR